MADSGSSRGRASLPDEPTFDDESRPYNPRRDSSSTLGSRRHSHYDVQRLERRSRSRPRSGASQTVSVVTSRSNTLKGKRASYQHPPYFEDLNEVTAPPPLDPDDYGTHLNEQYRQTGDPAAQGLPVRNFSQPYQRRRESRSRTREMNLSEVQALPPVPSISQRQSYLDAERQDTSQRSSVTPPYTSRHPDELAQRVGLVPRWLTELYTISYLIFFSIFGTLARLGLQWLTFYPGAPITTPVVWANMVGSMILGFLSEDQTLFLDTYQSVTSREKHEEKGPTTIDKAEMLQHKKTVPLYVGLAVGFCGSFTSYSSFARDSFLAISNDLPAPIYHTYTSPTGTVSPTATVGRHDGYSFESVTGIIIYTIALSLGGLFVGAHMAIFLAGKTPAIPVALARKLLDPSMILLGWGCWLGAVFLAIWPPDRPSGPASRGSWANETWRGEVLFALVFAPLGCLLRFYASLQLNALIAWFPLGTFAVNMFGTAVEAMCYDIQHVGVGTLGRVGGGRVGCQVLQGVQDGFCGCLTTVSTWVAEINGLRRKHGYFYALATLAGGLGLTVIIMGSVRWSAGFAEPVCDTGYPSKVFS